MTIKAILFDLDGVLIKAKQIHFDALNLALGMDYMISLEDHHGKYDGLPTKKKLEMLTRDYGLPEHEHENIWKKKQEFTLKMFATQLTYDARLVLTMNALKDAGYTLGVCSNSIRRSIYTALSNIGVIEYLDIILSADDVTRPKPYPEIYWQAMAKLGVLPEETLIVEDNPHGLLSAHRSKAQVLRVKDPDEVSYSLISQFIKSQETYQTMKNQRKWHDSNLNVLIPMAGAGSRFAQAGYTFPKPLIEVFNKTMIQTVVDNLGLDANYIFIVQREHRLKYNLNSLLKLIAPNCKVVEVDGITQGAACTALMAKEFINNKSPLFFANSDQYVEWDPVEFMYKMQESNVDGGIVTFESNGHPKWSYAKINEETGEVIEVAEKNPISNLATCGYYLFKHGSDFVRYAEQMIEKNLRVNNEFYVCPVFNQMIEDGKRIKTFSADRMWGLGTPEDLKVFIENFKE